MILTIMALLLIFYHCLVILTLFRFLYIEFMLNGLICDY